MLMMASMKVYYFTIDLPFFQMFSLEFQNVNIVTHNEMHLSIQNFMRIRGYFLSQ